MTVTISLCDNLNNLIFKKYGLDQVFIKFVKKSSKIKIIHIHSPNNVITRYQMHILVGQFKGSFFNCFSKNKITAAY